MAVLFGSLIVLIYIKRWHTILKIMDISISYKEAFNIMMSIYPFVSITPSMASDALRAYPLRDKLRASKTFGSILTEKVMDFSMLLVFLIIGIMVSKKFEFIFVTLVLFAGITLIFYITHKKINLPLKQIWKDRFQNVLLSMKTLTMDKKGFLIVILDSILIWFFSLVQIVMIFYAIGINIPFTPLIVYSSLAIIVGQIPVTLGGAGTRDAAFIFFFSEYGVPSQLLSVGILYSFFRVWIFSLIGLPFMRKALHVHAKSGNINIIQ